MMIRKRATINRKSLVPWCLRGNLAINICHKDPKTQKMRDRLQPTKTAPCWIGALPLREGNQTARKRFGKGKISPLPTNPKAHRTWRSGQTAQKRTAFLPGNSLRGYLKKHRVDRYHFQIFSFIFIFPFPLFPDT
jgi:hypothetical protein